MKLNIYLGLHHLIPRWLEYTIAVILTEDKEQTPRHYKFIRSATADYTRKLRH